MQRRGAAAGGSTGSAAPAGSGGSRRPPRDERKRPVSSVGPRSAFSPDGHVGGAGTPSWPVDLSVLLGPRAVTAGPRGVFRSLPGGAQEAAALPDPRGLPHAAATREGGAGAGREPRAGRAVSTQPRRFGGRAGTGQAEHAPAHALGQGQSHWVCAASWGSTLTFTSQSASWRTRECGLGSHPAASVVPPVLLLLGALPAGSAGAWACPPLISLVSRLLCRGGGIQRGGGLLPAAGVGHWAFPRSVRLHCTLPVWAQRALQPLSTILHGCEALLVCPRQGRALPQLCKVSSGVWGRHAPSLALVPEFRPGPSPGSLDTAPSAAWTPAACPPPLSELPPTAGRVDSHHCLRIPEGTGPMLRTWGVTPAVSVGPSVTPLSAAGQDPPGEGRQTGLPAQAAQTSSLVFTVASCVKAAQTRPHPTEQVPPF